MKKQKITGLWVGDSLPLMPQLCMQSFLDHGHEFQLFAYKPYANIPPGATVRDAREFLPEASIFRDSNGSLAPFSDWFRMKFLAEEGGLWVDMDVVCLSEEVPGDELWFCQERPDLVAVGALRFPPHHPIPTALARLAEDPAWHAPWDSADDIRAKHELRLRTPSVEERRRLVPWGFCGPLGMTRALHHYGLFDTAAPSSRIYPIPWPRWRECYDGSVRLASPLLRNAWAIHLWGELHRREPDAWENMRRNSVVGELLDKHLPGHAAAAPPEAEKIRCSVLVGICSCLTAGARRAACRETWLSHPQPGIECRFFLGRREPIPAEPDAVTLWVADDYDHLPAKGLAFYKWALERFDFDWLFKCDDDTYLALDRLPGLCDSRYDLIGDMSVEHRGFPSGGAGYLMSRALVEKIVACAASVPPTGAEDVIFGQLARDLGARFLATPRLHLAQGMPPHIGNDQVSCHWCSPERLREIHALFCAAPVAVMQGQHPHWQDELFFFRNGRFVRKSSGCTGDYFLKGEQSLTLKWDCFPAEVLSREGQLYRSGEFSLSPAPGQRPLFDSLLNLSD